ncbi:serine hydrolase domain-containing protein [Jiella avicenniae]|uniref:Beta-lactamase family protein n=1 Tax=Jiella avicenniae TaxID=2907202 RepID=A0A9X1P2Y3_9HYPH|nr:serine hydrolase domain-containing protein [Jiella avicenniae]MCE7028326.1 beta-lactamase family protein [Jiella avicenniae]
MAQPDGHAVRLTADGKAVHSGRTDATFPWWSFTKTILAIAALQLSERGALDLDAPYRGRPYTLRQLLQHRAGVPDYGKLAAYHAAVARGDPAWPRERLLAAVDVDTPDFAPGTGWAYSNVGYLFVREAIEAATASDLDTALRELVFAPLRLESARVAMQPADLAGVFWPALRGYDPRWVYHGLVVGTPGDAAAILSALMTPGRLLAPGTLAAMRDRHAVGGAIPGRPWTTHGYGLGLMIGTVKGAGRAIGHSGGGPFGVNAVYHFPDLDASVTVAAFTGGTDEGAAEWAATALATA